MLIELSIPHSCEVVIPKWRKNREQATRWDLAMKTKNSPSTPRRTLVLPEMQGEF